MCRGIASRDAGRMPNPTRRRRRRTTLIVTGLVLLAIVPVLGGALRLTDLAGGEQSPENSRFFEFGPLIIAHIVGATVYSVLGAFQFAPGLRRRRWHRWSGRVLVPAGLVAAGTGIWMSASPSLPDTNSLALVGLRVGFGALMVVALLLGLRAVLRRDIPTHRAWMIRAYAIGMGAGTQVFTLGLMPVVFGSVDATLVAIGMGAGWFINLAVAEAVIRRSRRRAVPPQAARRRPDAAFL